MQNIFAVVLVLTTTALLNGVHHEKTADKSDSKPAEATNVRPTAKRDYLPDRPLQLVRPDPESHRKLMLVHENVQHLHHVSESVAVVAVVGKFHTGKSFLLNQLMGKSSGFGVGPSVRPETMGIWMWGKPRVMKTADGKEISVIFLDTEGFSANNISETYDAKIFSVATLLSSYLLFNSVKIIDQGDIDYLELLARRTRLFALRSQMSKAQWVNDFNHDLLEFPPLMWVVQDFVQATSETPQQWIHRLMDTSSRDVEAHEISLLGIFDNVDCHTLFIPAVKKSLLQDLSQAKEKDLTEEYKAERDELVEKLRLGLIPKEKNGQPINGPELASLLHLLVDAANEGSLATIPGRWKSFIDGLKDSSRTDCVKFYEGEMMVIHQKYDDGPINATELEEWHEAAVERSKGLLQALLFGLPEAINASLVKMLGDMQEHYSRAAEINNKKIIIKCSEVQRRMEVEVESKLGEIKLPIAMSNLRKQFEEIKTTVEAEYRKTLQFLKDSNAFHSSFEQMENSLGNLRDAHLLKNKNALEALFKAAKETATSTFAETVQNHGHHPLTEENLQRKLDAAELDALKLFATEMGKAREEELFDIYQELTKAAILDKRQEVMEKNDKLIQQKCEETTMQLVGKFRSNTGPAKIPLPMNNTDLNARMATEMDLLLSEYSQTLAVFSNTEGYRKIKIKLNDDFHLICEQRRDENVAAYVKEVSVPLKRAKQVILLAADKHDTAFAVKTYMVDVCLLNLDDGKPKSWGPSLKMAIVEDYIKKDSELQALITSRNTIWLNIKGIFQWILTSICKWIGIS